jgi:hypothetical protein
VDRAFCAAIFWSLSMDIFDCPSQFSFFVDIPFLIIIYGFLQSGLIDHSAGWVVGGILTGLTLFLL